MFGKTKETHGIILNFAVMTDIAEHTERDQHILMHFFGSLGGNLKACVSVSASDML